MHKQKEVARAQCAGAVGAAGQIRDESESTCVFGARTLRPAAASDLAGGVRAQDVASTSTDDDWPRIARLIVHARNPASSPAL